MTGPRFKRGDQVVVSGAMLATYIKEGNTPAEAVISIGSQTQVVSVLSLTHGNQMEEVDYS